MPIKILATTEKADDWFEPDALYVAKHMLPKNKKLFYISPDDFLRLATPVKTKGGAPEKIKTVKELVKDKKKFDQIPFFRMSYFIDVDEDLKKHIKKDTGKIWGHEGRHRSMLLKSMGYKKIPVILNYQEMTTTPKYIINQTGKEKFLFSDIFKPYR